MKKQILLIFIAFFLLAECVSAKDLGGIPFYKDKIIKLVVGAGAGGGYDRMARILIRRLPKYIPGNPAIVIENMAGGGGLVAINNLYSLAKPDGLTIGTVNRSRIYGQLLKLDGYRFDMSKFSWIGSAGAESAVFVIRSTLPYKTIDDLSKTKDPIFVGNTGPLLVGAQFVPILKERLGQNLQFNTYPQSAEVFLALERKEVDGYGVSYSTAKPFIDRGVVRPIMRGPISAPGIENLPVNEDLCIDKKLKTIVSVLAASDRIGRPFVAPPGTPSGFMQILRNAFIKTVEDPETKVEAKKFMIEADYISDKEGLKIVNYVLNQPPDIVKEISKY